MLRDVAHVVDSKTSWSFGEGQVYRKFGYVAEAAQLLETELGNALTRSQRKPFIFVRVSSAFLLMAESDVASPCWLTYRSAVVKFSIFRGTHQHRVDLP